MTAVLLTPPTMQFFDNNGDPLSGGLIYSYDAGTLTPKATYTDQGGLTANANPVVLDSAGRASIWISGSYKIIVKTSAGVQVGPVQDNITSFSTGATGSVFSDASFFLQNSSDLTKQARFNLAGISTGTTSIITVPDGNFTIATTTNITEANISFTDITTNNSSSSKHGYLAKLSNTATQYMDGTGAWSIPAGTATSTAYGAVGTYAIFKNGGGALTTGATISGSSINYTFFSSAATPVLTDYGTNPSGTWRNMGGALSTGQFGIFVRTV